MERGTIKDSIHIPRGMLEFWLDPQSSYYKEKKLIIQKNGFILCFRPKTKALATKTLKKEMGFENVAEISGVSANKKKQILKLLKK